MSLLDDASIVITPNGVKAGTLFAVIPSDGAADMDCVRASATTEVDGTGLPVYVAPNVPRINLVDGCPVISAEPESENLVFPSDVGVTQTRTVAAVEHVLTFYGTGAIVLSGTYSGILVGSGATDRVELKLTPTAGSLTLTVSGSATDWQLEEGSYPTSVIDTVSGTVTRAKDQFSKSGISSLINSAEGVLFVEMAASSDDGTNRILGMSNGSFNYSVLLRYASSSNTITAQVRLGGVYQCTLNYTVTDVLDYHKIAFKYKVDDFELWVDGFKRDTAISGDVVSGLDELSLSVSSSNQFYGNIKQLAHLPFDTDVEDLTA
jgi:hypothetical protein